MSKYYDDIYDELLDIVPNPIILPYGRDTERIDLIGGILDSPFQAVISIDYDSRSMWASPSVQKLFVDDRYAGDALVVLQKILNNVDFEFQSEIDYKNEKFDLER